MSTDHVLAVDAAEASRVHPRPHALGRAWFGVIGPALAMLVNLQANYSLAPLGCIPGIRWPMHLTNAVMLAVAIAGGLAAWSRRESAAPDEADEDAGPGPALRLLGVLGTILAPLFGLIILGQWVAVAMVRACG